MKRALGLALLAGVALAGCSREKAAPAAEEPPASAPDPAGPAASAALNRITSLAVRDGRVLVGTDAGVLVLDAQSGAWALLGEDAGTHELLNDAVTAVAFGPDGSAWSSHASGPTAPPLPRGFEGARRGGVRQWSLDAPSAPAVWLADDGLGQDDVAALGVSEDVVAVAVGRAVAVLALADATRLFVRRMDEDSLRVTVVPLADPEAPPRTVTELRPTRERVLAVAASGQVMDVGTTHGLYRLGLTEAWRFEIPCQARRHERTPVVAVTHDEHGLLVASLGSGGAGDSWIPAGVLEVAADFSHRCHAPGVDVPASPTLAVSAHAGVIHLATNEGLTRVEGNSVELFDAAGGAPAGPVTAVADDGAGGCWAGTWGNGVFHVTGRTFHHHRFSAESRVAPATEGTLR